MKKVLAILTLALLFGCGNPKGDIWELELPDGSKIYGVSNFDLTLSSDGRVLHNTEASVFKGTTGARSLRVVGQSK